MSLQDYLSNCNFQGYKVHYFNLVIIQVFSTTFTKFTVVNLFFFIKYLVYWTVNTASICSPWTADQLPGWWGVRHEHWANMGTGLRKRGNHQLRTALQRRRARISGAFFTTNLLKCVVRTTVAHVISSNIVIFHQTGKENIWPNLFLCGGWSTCKYRILLLSGCRLQQRHWSLHQRNIPKDIPSQYVVHFLS